MCVSVVVVCAYVCVLRGGGGGVWCVGGGGEAVAGRWPWSASPPYSTRAVRSCPPPLPAHAKVRPVRHAKGKRTLTPSQSSKHTSLPDLAFRVSPPPAVVMLAAPHSDLRLFCANVSHFPHLRAASGVVIFSECRY